MAAAATGLFYLRSGFVWDDVPLIAQRLALLDVNGILSLWTGPVTESGPGSAYYRPVAMTVLALLGRVGPVAIHCFALLLHATSAYLLVRLCTGLRAPMLAGLIFALHPLVGEVLGWSSALPDALAVCLSLLAVFIGRRTPWLGFLVLLLGFWSKETAAIVAICVGVGTGNVRRIWVPLTGAVVVGLVGRALAGVGATMVKQGNIDLLPDALGWAMSGLVWPMPLHVIRDVLVAPDMLVVVGWVLVLVLAMLSGRSRAAWAGLALTLAAHAVAMPAVLDGYLLGARYSYPALVGLGLWVASVMPWRLRPWLLVLLAALALRVHAVDSQRWRTNLTLFDDVEDSAYGSGLAWHLYAMANLEASRFGEAGRAFDLALASKKPFPGDETLRIVAWVSAGEHRRAFEAAETGPKDALTAEHVAWWARAAWGAGERARARALLSQLRVHGGYDGPPWLGAFANAVFDEGSTEDASSPSLSP